MKKMLVTTLIALCCTIPTLSFSTNTPLLVLDAPNIAELPRNFRIVSEPLNEKIRDSEGLTELHMIGSAQFSEKQLQAVLKQYPQANPLTIVDLRQESHGFVNGDAISWFGMYNAANKDKTPTEVEKTQQHLLVQLEGHVISVAKIINKIQPGIIGDVQPIKMQATTVFSEETLAKKMSLKYIRFYTTDFTAPNREQTDRFIIFAKELPQNTWIYFHCRGGIGRTTTFMAMYDMMHNAKKVSFRTIIQRQAAIGGKDLTELPSSRKMYRYPLAKTRLEFLKKFYDYSKENQDNFQTSWSEWLRQQQKS